MTAILLCLHLGCGGTPDNLGHVTGTVTLDGQPVADALVSFTPKQEGKANSNGRTDAQGRYTLIYPGSVEGAEIGEHEVRITTFVDAIPDNDPPTERVAEKIPAIYNSKTTLTQKVEKGGNTIDFDLKSEGEIIQPDQVRSRGD